jgi:hypothetical protein
MLTPEIIQDTYSEEIYRLPDRVWVLLDEEWNALSDEMRQLLGKILSAVNLTAERVHILSMKEIDLNSLSAVKPSAVLSFGSRILQPISPYEVADHTGIPIIAADSLTKLDEHKKKLLWVALRQVFKRT